MVYRVFVEKKKELAQEAKSLLGEARDLLGIKNLTDVRVINRYDAENITQALNVTVRAPQEVLDRISEVNLRAVADLSNLGTNASGVFTPTVEIKIDGFPEAGCVGEYKIYITLKEKR